MTNQNPLISVAMTTYNGEKYLSEQIDSIINQTYKNIEIIICDDSSTDNTINILKEYENKYNNIKIYLNESNIGLNNNFEKAIKKCNGEYIAISDQDDIWNENKIELLLNNIGNNYIICSKKIDIDKNNEILPDIHIKSFEYAKKFKYDKLNFLNIYFTDIVWGCTSLIKKDFLLKCLPFPSKDIIYYDHWICISAFVNKSLKYIDTATMKHRIHSNNLTRNTILGNPYIRWIKNLNKEKIETEYKIYIKKIDLIIEKLEINEDYKQIITDMKEIYESILNFKFSKKDFKLLQKEFILYKKIDRRFIFIIKSIAERIILAFLSH